MQTRPAAPMRGLDSTERGVIHSAGAAGEFRASHNLDPGEVSGLDLLRDADLAPEREEVKEPAKRWRNWWCAPYRGVSMRWDGGDWWRVPVGVSSSPPVYPSKEVAETAARDGLALLSEATGYTLTELNAVIEYLGAFPDGEAP